MDGRSLAGLTVAMAPRNQLNRKTPVTFRRYPQMFTALLAATLAGACASDEVESKTPTTITVSPDATLHSLGETVQLIASVRDQNGAVMTDPKVRWESDDASKATVDPSGLVTAVANGDATVTATTESTSATATATVTVDQVAATVAIKAATHTFSTDGDNIRVSPGDTTHVRSAFGDTLRLSAKALDANQNPVHDARFTWTSGDTLVAVVVDTGLVTWNSDGPAKITVEADSRPLSMAELSVNGESAMGEVPAMFRRPVRALLGKRRERSYAINGSPPSVPGRIGQIASAGWKRDPPHAPHTVIRLPFQARSSRKTRSSQLLPSRMSKTTGCPPSAPLVSM